MGATASSNSPAFGNLVEFVGLVGDVDQHMSQASMKRKKSQEKRDHKRKRRDVHNKRRRHRQRRALKSNKNSSRPGSRANVKDISRSDFKKIKSQQKDASKNLIEETLLEALQNSLKTEQADKETKLDFGQKNNEKLRENPKRREQTQLYDLTNSDMQKIYDLRTLYTTVNKGNEQELLDSIALGNRSQLYASCRNSKYVADDGLPYFNRDKDGIGLRNSSRQRSRTINISDQSFKNTCDEKESFFKRHAAQYTSLRVAESDKSAHTSRFSFRFPGRRSSSKDSPSKTLANENKGRLSSTPNRIDSYLDSSFLESDVSFHMQGPPRKSHVVLASASAVPFENNHKTSNGNRNGGYGASGRLADFNTNKENEVNGESRSAAESKHFGRGRLGSKLYTRTLRQLNSNRRTNVIDDTIQEEAENLYQGEKQKYKGGARMGWKSLTVKPHKLKSANSEMCSSGVTPVYLASQEGHLPVLQELVAAGGRLDHPAADGLTPVHAAAQMGCTQVLQYMLSVDPRLVHIRDADGATPLHFCASRGHLTSARLLLTNGASPDHADLWGKTPVHDAIENRHQEMVRLLMQHSDLPGHPTEVGETSSSKGRHSSGSTSSSGSGSSSKKSSGRHSNTNTRRRQSSRQPSSSSQSPFYLHPPDDANNPKTSPPSPCSHHAPPDEFINSSVPPAAGANSGGMVIEVDIEDDAHYTEINGMNNNNNNNNSNSSHSDGQLERASPPNGSSPLNHQHSSKTDNGFVGSSGSNSSMRSNSRNSNESNNSNSDSINSSSNMSANSNSSNSSSSSSMLQDLRDTATQQQQQQQSTASDTVPEPFYLHKTDTAGNTSPLQKLFTRADQSKGEHSRRSSTKSHGGGEAVTKEREQRHLQSLDDLVTGVPPPDYETEDSHSPSTNSSPSSSPHHQRHSPLTRIKSEPSPPPLPISSPPPLDLTDSHSLPPTVSTPKSPTASSVGGFVPPPPPPPPAPLLAVERSSTTDSSEDFPTNTMSAGSSKPSPDSVDSTGSQELSDSLTQSTTGEGGAATAGSGSTGSATSGGRGLASISIAQLQSVQLRKTQPRDPAKSHSVPLMIDASEKSLDKSEVIAELKRSVDVGSPSKLKHQQQQQQQQQKQENLQVQITPEQIISKVPQVDSAGLPIPEWKRQMLARRAAERATAEEQQNRLQQLEMKRLQQLPPWKRQLLEKRSTSSGGSTAPTSLYMPRVVEPRKITVALTASR